MNAKELIQQINEQVQKNANVRVVFGEAIEKGTITIIPVAKVTLRGGGGGGGNPPEKTPADETTPKDKPKGFGMGLGLEIKTTPLGYIEIKDGQARFKEIEDSTRVALAGIALAGFIFFTVGRIISLSIRSSRRKASKLSPTGAQKGK